MLKFKKVIVIVLSAACLLGNMSAFAASTSASVKITKKDSSKESSAVGISRKALFKASNSSSSASELTMKAYACWTGWPYTCETTTNISPSGSYKYTEPQDKNSNFYIKLTGYRACSGSGSVTIK